MLSTIQRSIIALLIAVGCYYYWLNVNLKEEVQNLTTINSQLEEVNKSNEKYISNLTSNYNSIISINGKLNETSLFQQKKIDELLVKSKEHNLTTLAVKKPKVIQKIINKATFKEFRCIENITKGVQNECK